MTRIKRIENILHGSGVERDPAPKPRRGIPQPTAKPWKPIIRTPISREQMDAIYENAFVKVAVHGVPPEQAVKDALASILEPSWEPEVYRCTSCGAEDIGDRPDCPEDGIHCNIVEKG